MRSFSETPDATIGFSAKLRIFYILGSTHETYHSPLSKHKTTHSGGGGKKLLNDLAVTYSWLYKKGIIRTNFYSYVDSTAFDTKFFLVGTPSDCSAIGSSCVHHGKISRKNSNNFLPQRAHFSDCR